MVTLQLQQLDVPPDQRLLLHDVSWAEFEAILAALGEHRGSPITYDKREYVEVVERPTFPGWPLHSTIPIYVEQRRVEGRNKAMRSFRQWVKERMSDY